MGAFQWNKSHVDMFVERFKGSSECIDARTVQKEFRSFQRKVGIQKLYAQDFRNLMRFVVWNKFARVTQDCITSRNYKIRMVSDEYPYLQELFDTELFDNQLLKEPIHETSALLELYFPDIDKSEWNSSFQKYRENWLVMARLYHEAFLIHNLHGGDYDRLFKFEGVLFNRETRDSRSDLCKCIKHYVCQYKAFKLAENDLTAIFNRRGAIPVELAGRKMFLTTDASDYNSLFAEVFQSSIILKLFKTVKGQQLACKKPGSNYYRKQKEYIEDFKKGSIVPAEETFDDISHEYLNLLMTSNFWLCLPFISEKEEVLGAYRNCQQSFINEMQTFPHLKVIPVKHKNKPPTNIV
jgi:hypothetical protein